METNKIKEIIVEHCGREKDWQYRTISFYFDTEVFREIWKQSQKDIKQKIQHVINSSESMSMETIQMLTEIIEQ